MHSAASAILGAIVATTAPHSDGGDPPAMRTHGAVTARPACGYRDAPRNLLARSSEFPGSPWELRASTPELLPRIKAAAQPGPDGVPDAVAVEFDTKGVPSPESWSCIEAQVTCTAGTTYTFSFSVKGPEGSFLAARGAAGAGYSRIPLNGRWQRVHLTEQATTRAPSLRIGLGVHRPDEPVPSGSVRVLLRAPQLSPGAGIVPYEPSGATLPPQWPLELVPPGAVRRPCAPTDRGEGEATNLLRWSTALDKQGWHASAPEVGPIPGGPSPTGTQDAWVMRESKDPGPHRISRAFESPTAPITASAYVKPQARAAVMLSIASSNGNAEARFDLSADGAAASATGATARIERVGQGWYRVMLTVAGEVPPEDSTFVLTLLDAPGGSIDYPGNGTSGLLVWGPQVESGTTATSYIPTFFVPETRGADEPVKGPSPE